MTEDLEAIAAAAVARGPAPEPVAAPADPLLDPLLWLKQRSYTWAGLSAVPYDRTRPDLFQPQPYLAHLWQQTRDSGRSSLGSLPALYCSMQDLSCDAICSYLHARLVLVLGEYRAAPLPEPVNYQVEELITDSDLDDPLAMDEDWIGLLPAAAPPSRLHALGYAFPGTVPITTSADGLANSMFIGYTFFQQAWRSPAQLALTYLGLAFFFQEFRLEAIHGVRYADNKLTAKWAAKFGFQDCGTVPSFMRGPGGGAAGSNESSGRLTAATFSTLSRMDFVARLRVVLAGALGEDDTSH